MGGPPPAPQKYDHRGAGGGGGYIFPGSEQSSPGGNGGGANSRGGGGNSTVGAGGGGWGAQGGSVSGGDTGASGGKAIVNKFENGNLVTTEKSGGKIYGSVTFSNDDLPKLLLNPRDSLDQSTLTIKISSMNSNAKLFGGNGTQTQIDANGTGDLKTLNFTYDD